MPHHATCVAAIAGCDGFNRECISMEHSYSKVRDQSVKNNTERSKNAGRKRGGQTIQAVTGQCSGSMPEKERVGEVYKRSQKAAQTSQEDMAAPGSTTSQLCPLPALSNDARPAGSCCSCCAAPCPALPGPVTSTVLAERSRAANGGVRRRAASAARCCAAGAAAGEWWR